MARRSLLVDFITVYGLGGKAIVFTETKREADEVAAALANTHPCEARRPCFAVGVKGSRVYDLPARTPARCAARDDGPCCCQGWCGGQLCASCAAPCGMHASQEVSERSCPARAALCS